MEMETAKPKSPTHLPSSVWAMGFASLLMDLSSELIHSLLPSFMVSVLGASMMAVGFIEGVAEATASITKVFSGALSDYFGKRKGLMVSGYALAAFTKPIFPLASSIGWVFTARFVDRIGKGIRGAPRDALIADVTPEAQRGTAYGLRQSLDTAGAVAGPLAALVLMTAFAADIRRVLWFATVPAFGAVLLLALGVREPSHSTRRQGIRRISFTDAKNLGPTYWSIVVLGGILTLARFSEAFLLLRAQSGGLSVIAVPITLTIMNLVYAASSYPAGKAADRLDRRFLLALGVFVLLVADIVLAASSSLWMIFAGTALWGLHMGLTQGLLATLIAATAAPTLRGTAFGVFNLISGGCLLLSSLIAGFLWNHYGPFATFAAGAIFSAVTLLLSLRRFEP